MVELKVLGIYTDGAGQNPFLLLHGRGADKLLRINVSPVEALALHTTLSGVSKTSEGLECPPPQSYALAIRMLREAGGVLRGVEIKDLDEYSSSAEVIIHNGTTLKRVPGKAADAIALALSAGVVIRASTKLLAKAEDFHSGVYPEYAEVLGELGLEKKVKPAFRAEDSSDKDMDEYMSLAMKAALAVTESFQKKETGTAEKKSETRAESGIKDDDVTEYLKEGKAVAELLLRQAESLVGGKKEKSSRVKTPKITNVKISVVRQSKSGEMEVVDEIELDDVPVQRGHPPVSLLNTVAGGEVKGRDEEYWSNLLKMLTPETKVLM